MKLNLSDDQIWRDWPIPTSTPARFNDAVEFSARFDDVDDELSVIQRDLTRITTSNCFLNLSSSSINLFSFGFLIRGNWKFNSTENHPFVRVCVIGDDDASSEPNWGIDHSTVVNVKELHISPPILADKSPFFYKLFSNGMRESEQRHVTLRISAQDVLMAADKFEVASCMRYCSRLLCNMPMTPDSALLYLELPSSVLMAEAVEPLTDAAKQFLASSFDEDPAGVNMQPVLKSCLKRLFDHCSYTNVLSCSISEKLFLDMTEFEPIFVC
ncbi:BTB/POZ domain protein [Raphanus sativus]|nr:BTB/POZ domain protein [Raphanus sativus]